MTNLDSASAFNEAYAIETAEHMQATFGKDTAQARAEKNIARRGQEHPAFWRRVVEIITGA
jgi:hypothetical protein